MGLVERAKSDWKRFSSNNTNGFGVPITFTTPDEATSAAVNGLATKHHLAYDSDGNAVSSQRAQVSIAEELLTDESYPVRTAGEVTLVKHKVSFQDSSGATKTYVITETFPDETTGMITCILGNYE